ncbi:putative serine/threonine protein kinase [Diachasmimorpha longicaudata entomopoxvirus]|uniref:Serine/threonine-protein kinase 2 n=1 Tax=Diachasmimorpha longicaudata entomopoxvirus TaxID=109981 RepID=A0A7R5WCV6_9POXV|nr:putative serine/threonine protein kinase [Diachasmimorpha longicaudata entomopoxvirus]AKS26312.1 putative serine/threonine protein kinase [Diachasmimorpha longicaudata entomopoxvirus]
MSKFYNNIIFADTKSTDTIGVLWFIQKLNALLGPDQYGMAFKKILNDYEHGEIKESKQSYKVIKLIGVGGYGFVFGLSSTLVAKINIDDPEEQSMMDDDDQHEFTTPLALSKNNSELKDLIVLPIMTITQARVDSLLKMFEIHTLISIITYSLLTKKVFSVREIQKHVENFSFSLLDLTRLRDQTFWRLFQHKYRRITSHYLKKSQVDFLSSFNRLVRALQDKEYPLKTGSLIVMPKAEGTSLALYPFYEHHLSNKQDYFRILYLQVILFILKTSDIRNFVHNDLKLDNVLVFATTEPYDIHYEGYQFTFNIPFRFKISDFDFSKIDNITNTRIIGSSISKSLWFHDLHFFSHKFLASLTHIKMLKSDEIFYMNIFERFIQPMCNGDFPINVKKNQKCADGRLNVKDVYDKKILSDFLGANFFDQWRTS